MELAKSQAQIAKIRRLADIISAILEKSIGFVKPGLTTAELDRHVEGLMRDYGVNGPCKGYHGFPAVSCISVNDCITHGIPDGTVLKPGDLVDIDIVIESEGYFADISKTVGIGEITPAALRLMKTAEECMYKAIELIRPRATLGDIGYAVQSHAESRKFSVVREYCGHFIGTAMHEGPPILNYGTPGSGLRLEAGMILCIEPMINAGKRGVVSDEIGWNTKTRDNSLSSRCEHMVLVTQAGHEILTRHPDILTV